MNCRRGLTPAADESPLDSGQVELEVGCAQQSCHDEGRHLSGLKTEASEPIRSAEGLGRVTQS